MASVRIGVVLSAGGVRGVYAHTGFLQALSALRIEIAALAGCSAGAISGGIAASGGDLKRWSDAIAAVTPRQFWRPEGLPRLLWRLVVRQGRGWTGLATTDHAVAFFSRFLGARRFEDCRYPFHSLALSLLQGTKRLFSSGELAPRMMASAAVPVVYRPVELDGDLYTDGGLIDLSPLDAICCRHGLDALLVHHVSKRFQSLQTPAQLVGRRWAMGEILERLLSHQRPWYLGDGPLTFRRCRCGCEAAIVVVEPQLPDLRWPLTSGGPVVQAAARGQAVSLLRPHLAALCSDPRARLPRAADDPAARSFHARGCPS